MNNHRLSRLVAAFLLPLPLLLSCHAPQNDDDASLSELPYEEQPRIEALAQLKSDAFALQVFRALASSQQGNVIFSPASLEGLLHLLKQGSKGQTSRELSALPMGQQDVPTTMQVTEASALFLNKDVQLKPGIKADAILPAPFSSDPALAADTINHWVHQSTKGMVPSLIKASDISPWTRMVAAQALCLEEKWLRPFMAEASREGVAFHLRDGRTAPVRMMSHKSNYLYAEGKDWKAVALFYRTDGRTGHPACFIGILPKGDARDFAATLTEQKFSHIRRALAAVKPVEVHVSLPSFESLTDAFSLKEILEALGLRQSFSKQADFTGFTDTPFFLQDVLQRCYVKVNEQGSRAAAVTAALMPYAIPIDEPKEITFDKPFLWVISDLDSAAPPFFMGLYEQP